MGNLKTAHVRPSVRPSVCTSGVMPVFSDFMVIFLRFFRVHHSCLKLMKNPVKNDSLSGGVGGVRCGIFVAGEPFIFQ